MSNLPPTACSTPGCAGYAELAGKCSSCATPVIEGRIDQHDHHRSWKKLYNCVRWKQLREAVLRRDPICVACKRNASTIADHIKDHRGNPVLFYDIKNLRGLCKPCHDEKTGSTHGKGDRPGPFKPALENGCIHDYALEHK